MSSIQCNYRRDGEDLANAYQRIVTDLLDRLERDDLHATSGRLPLIFRSNF